MLQINFIRKEIGVCLGYFQRGWLKSKRLKGQNSIDLYKNHLLPKVWLKFNEAHQAKTWSKGIGLAKLNQVLTKAV